MVSDVASGKLGTLEENSADVDTILLSSKISIGRLCSCLSHFSAQRTLERRVVLFADWRFLFHVGK